MARRRGYKGVGWVRVAVLGILLLHVSCSGANRANALHSRIEGIIEAHGVEGDLKDVVVNRALELHAQGLSLERQAADVKAFIGYVEKAQDLVQGLRVREASVVTLGSVADALLMGIPEEVIKQFIQGVPDRARGPVLDRVSRLVLADMSVEDAATLVALDVGVPLPVY